MSKKSSKFIQLEWKCPGCDARNPGPEQSCLSCGAPQPADVEFIAPVERKLVRDEKSLERAKAGADIYCAFCETRNAATEKTCVQCGADLGEGEKRKSGGEVRQRVAEKMVLCPSCEAENTSSSHSCSACGSPLGGEKMSAEKKMTVAKQVKNTRVPKNRKWLIGLVLAIILCCIAGFAFLFLAPSQSVTGIVERVHWQTDVTIQEESETHYSDERGSPPSDAYDISCHTEREEVCTEEMIDQGNGYAEVVETCETNSEEYCSYTVLEWETVKTLTLEGDNFAPEYVNPSLEGGQRLGEESVEYTVTFSTDTDVLNYSVDDLGEYKNFQIGSEWTLNMNRLGSIISVER